MQYPLTILFGSQTGNAQDVAERIEREAKARHYAARTVAMNAYDIRQLPQEQAVIFVASTTGQGEVPDNMKRLWRFLLNRNLPAESLCQVQNAVFGLGDSGYAKYNVVALKLAQRLRALGARSLVSHGLGDDAHPTGYEAALDPWLAALWPALRARFPLPPGVTEPAPGDTSMMLAPKHRVEVLLDDRAADAAPAQQPVPQLAERHAALSLARLDAAAAGACPPADAQPPGFGPHNPVLARVAENRRLTAAGHFQDVRHLSFDLEQTGLQHDPGDALALVPRQPDAAVHAFLQCVGLLPDARLQVTLAHSAPDDVEPPAFQVAARDLVAGALDINGASPRRSFLEVLQQFAEAPVEAERLQYLASPEGRDDMYRYNQREGRTVLEVLQDFPSARPPLEWLLQTVPRLRPRLFSISSALTAFPAQAHITAAIVDWVTPFKRRRQGVCTSWLATLDPQRGEVHVPVWVERGAFGLPADPATPLILVGPGTGVAPFRAFLQRRQQTEGAVHGPVHLFFGCRNADSDFLYREEWEQLQQAGVLVLHTACSRDQPQKVYVTHLIREQASAIWQLLQQGAVIYVSGSANKMPQDVMAAFEDVIVSAGLVERGAAKQYLRTMEQRGRYRVEAWS